MDEVMRALTTVADELLSPNYDIKKLCKLLRDSCEFIQKRKLHGLYYQHQQQQQEVKQQEVAQIKDVLQNHAIEIQILKEQMQQQQQQRQQQK